MKQDKYTQYIETLELDAAGDRTPTLAEVKRAYQRLKRLYTSETMDMVTEPIDDEFSPKDKQEMMDQLEEAYKKMVHFLVEKDRVEKEAFQKAGIIEEPVIEYKPQANFAKPSPHTALKKNALTEADIFELSEIPNLPEEDEMMEEFEESGERTAGPSRKIPAANPEPPRDIPGESPVTGRSLRKAREKSGMGVHEVAKSTRINYKVLVNIEKERFHKLPDAGYIRWAVRTYAETLSMDPSWTADEYMKRYRQWYRERNK
jgi:hypothetical protein